MTEADDQVDDNEQEPESSAFVSIIRANVGGGLVTEDDQVSTIRIGPCPVTPDVGPTVSVEFFTREGTFIKLL